jgi:hypothetical protein
MIKSLWGKLMPSTFLPQVYHVLLLTSVIFVHEASKVFHNTEVNTETLLRISSNTIMLEKGNFSL